MLKASKHEAGSKIRSRQRAVADYDVDRPQVQAWRHVEPSGTNCPKVPEKEKEEKKKKKATGPAGENDKSRGIVCLPVSVTAAGFHMSFSRATRPADPGSGVVGQENIKNKVMTA